VQTEIPEHRARRQGVADQDSRRLRDQDLAAVGDRGQPGGAMDIQTHQAGLRLGRRTGVDTHPHPDVLGGGPGVALDGPLHLHRRRHALPRRGEHGEERVALGVHFLAVVSGQARPDERVMIGQDLRVETVSQPPQGRRRALDVGKQERDCP
jgi:hypothetical protein